MANYAILLDTDGDLDEAEKYYRLAIGLDRFNPLHCFNYSSFLKNSRGDATKAAKFELIGRAPFFSSSRRVPTATAEGLC